MHILWQLEAQRLEQLNMEGQGRQPFVAPDNVGGAHQVIVYGVGKMVGGNTVGFQQNMVNVVFRDSQLAFHQIIKFELILDGAGGTEPENPGHSGIQLGLNVLHGAIPPHGIFPIVAGGLLVRLLLLPHGGQLLLGAEAGIGHALGDQLFGVDMVDIRPLTLAVGAVGAVVAIHGGALVKVDAVVLQGVNQNLHRAGNLPLGIGVLHPQEQYAAALMGHPLGGQTLHQIAQMDKTRGGGSHPGNHRALGQPPGGIFFFERLRSFCHVGEQKRGQCLIIHSQIPLFP